MVDLGLDVERVLSWFPHEQDVPYVLVRVKDDDAIAWAKSMGLVIRRCYITDALLGSSAVTRNVSQLEVIAAKLPDPGSTMAGDFGEILSYLYQGAREHPNIALGATKWRLKQDRTKPAPLSDVVHFVLPEWPMPTDRDCVLCSEVKTKSTPGPSTPVLSAIADCAKDRTSRLARTLTWLRERALVEDLGDLKLEHLNRFINATEYPKAQKRFRAIAVVCATLLAAELASAPNAVHADYTLIVLSVPDLQRTYASLFESARQAVVPEAGPKDHLQSRQ